MQRRLQQWAYRPEGLTEPLVLRTTDLMRSALILSKNTGWTLGHCRPDKKDVRVVQEGAFSLTIQILLVRMNHLGQKGHLWTGALLYLSWTIGPKQLLFSQQTLDWQRCWLDCQFSCEIPWLPIAIHVFIVLCNQLIVLQLWMLGYLILLPSQTATPPSRQLTGIMRTSRNDTMRRGSEKWNIHLLQQVASLGPAACSFYKRLASMLAEKWNQPYSSTMGWLRCRLSFSLLCFSIMCLRGARSSAHKFESHFAAAVDHCVRL